MSSVAFAIGGSAVLGYLGSQQAAGAQRDAANQANATQQGQYNQTRADQIPWMNRGNAAGDRMAYLLGLNVPQTQTQNTFDANAYLKQNPDVAADPRWGADPYGHYLQYGQREGRDAFWTPQAGSNTGASAQQGGFGSLSTPFSQTNWQADPGYAFRLAEGQKALERSGSARGMTLSGAQQKALMGYGQGMASQEYGNAYNRYTTDQTNLYNRLAGVAGTGQTAANQIGTFGVNAANQISSNQLGVGNANAAAWTAGTGALSNGLNSWGNWSAWNNLNGGSGAGGGTGPTNGTTFGEW